MMVANWANELYIGTAKSGDTWTYHKLCQGIESMEFSANEQNQKYFFLCGNGFAHNEVTGAAPHVTISGKRILGDPAQDFIVGKQFALENNRKTSVKIIVGGKEIVCDATIGDVTSFGGQTLDVNAFGCTIYFNGAPTVTTADPMTGLLSGLSIGDGYTITPDLSPFVRNYSAVISASSAPTITITTTTYNNAAKVIMADADGHFTIGKTWTYEYLPEDGGAVVIIIVVTYEGIDREYFLGLDFRKTT